MGSIPIDFRFSKWNISLPMLLTRPNPISIELILHLHPYFVHTPPPPWHILRSLYPSTHILDAYFSLTQPTINGNTIHIQMYHIYENDVRRLGCVMLHALSRKQKKRHASISHITYGIRMLTATTRFTFTHSFVSGCGVCKPLIINMF